MDPSLRQVARDPGAPRESALVNPGTFGRTPRAEQSEGIGEFYPRSLIEAGLDVTGKANEQGLCPGSAA